MNKPINFSFKITDFSTFSQKILLTGLVFQAIPLRADMSTVCTGANRGVSRYLTENYPGLGIFTQVLDGCRLVTGIFGTFRHVTG
jgi:hypothetical protein